jgi:hypothetical protein
VAIAETTIERRSGAFDLETFRGRYQDALREMVEAKTKRSERPSRRVPHPRTVVIGPGYHPRPIRAERHARDRAAMAFEHGGDGGRP